VYQLHREIEVATIHEQLVQRHEVRVAGVGKSAKLPLEMIHAAWICVAEPLERNRPSPCPIASRENRSRGACSESAEQVKAVPDKMRSAVALIEHVRRRCNLWASCRGM
jgi:hypothetical protein